MIHERFSKPTKEMIDKVYGIGPAMDKGKNSNSSKNATMNSWEADQLRKMIDVMRDAARESGIEFRDQSGLTDNNIIDVEDYKII